MDDRLGVNLDCRGMKCPRPIIELARARRNALPGTIISIIADDLAFESDVKAWCQTTGNKIIDFNKEENTVKSSEKNTVLTEKFGEIKLRLWYCKQCGYVAFREDPPYICPICKAKREMFNAIKM